MAQVQPRKIGIGQGTSFLSESVAELKKVTFPTRQQTFQAAIVTIFIVMFVALTLFILDIIFGQVMRAILS